MVGGRGIRQTKWVKRCECSSRGLPRKVLLHVGDEVVKQMHAYENGNGESSASLRDTSVLGVCLFASVSYDRELFLPGVKPQLQTHELG